jgi:serine/threonine-protein kinase
LVDVPALRNLRPPEARAVLDPLGLLLTIEQESEDTQVEPGRIRQQSPLEGSRVRRGEAVRVQIARAPTTLPAPNVTGVSPSKAKEALQQAGLAVGKLQYRDNEDRPDGVVLEQTPPAGQPVAKGQKIDLVVNRWD